MQIFLGLIVAVSLVAIGMSIQGILECRRNLKTLDKIGDMIDKPARTEADIHFVAGALWALRDSM